jgi:hypothetical protein
MTTGMFIIEKLNFFIPKIHQVILFLLLIIGFIYVVLFLLLLYGLFLFLLIDLVVELALVIIMMKIMVGHIGLFTFFIYYLLIDGIANIMLRI